MKSIEEINKEAIQLVRELVGPVAAFRLVGCVASLPKTRSGKIARKSISDLARDKKVAVTSIWLFLFFSLYDVDDFDADPSDHWRSISLRRSEKGVATTWVRFKRTRSRIDMVTDAFHIFFFWKFASCKRRKTSCKFGELYKSSICTLCKKRYSRAFDFFRVTCLKLNRLSIKDLCR